MPTDVYTIDYEVSDPGDTIACQVSIKTGITTCLLQQWTLNGFYRESESSNVSTGIPYEGKFIVVQVCDPNGSYLFDGTGINGYYAWVNGSNTDSNSGDFPSWNNLISSNGSSTININPYSYLNNQQPPQNWNRQGWSSQYFNLFDNTGGYFEGLLSMIARQSEITGGSGLVYNGPYGPRWSLTAGTGTTTPLSPSENNYQFSFVY